MKCKQKLCNRNKNIENSGNCLVCENVLLANAKRLDDKKSLFDKKVEVDLELMVTTHDMLSGGVPVEQSIVGHVQGRISAQGVWGCGDAS